MQFALEYPQIYQNWMKNPFLVLLALKNEYELISFISKLQQNQIKYSIFREPDINNQLTSVCIEPSELTRKLTSNIPIMLKGLGSSKQIDKNNFS